MRRRAVWWVIVAATVFCAQGIAQTGDGPPADQDAPTTWNLKVPESTGHTGRMLIRAEGQLHEGPGQTGEREARFHWHGRNPSTGELERPGIALDAEMRPVRPVTTTQPASSPTAPSPDGDGAVTSNRPSQELLQKWTACITPSVEAALLARDWQELRARLLAPDEALLSPISLFLLGHTYLVANQLDEALNLFLSGAGHEACLVGWQEWAESWARAHPKEAIAQFLRGDAAGRRQQWGAAIEAFSQALSLDADFPLALDARAVARFASGDQSGAIEDLDRLTSTAPEFADGHASLGLCWVQARAPEGALAAYERALSKTTESALLQNGRGCALFGLGLWEQARQTFRDAARPVRDSELGLLLDHNLSQLTSEEARCYAEYATAGYPVGTTITRTDQVTSQAYLDFTTQLHANPARAAEVTKRVVAQYGPQGVVAINQWYGETVATLNGLHQQVVDKGAEFTTHNNRAWVSEGLRPALDTYGDAASALSAVGAVIAKTPEQRLGAAAVGQVGRALEHGAAHLGEQRIGARDAAYAAQDKLCQEVVATAQISKAVTATLEGGQLSGPNMYRVPYEADSLGRTTNSLASCIGMTDKRHNDVHVVAAGAARGLADSVVKDLQDKGRIPTGVSVQVHGSLAELPANLGEKSAVIDMTHGTGGGGGAVAGRGGSGWPPPPPGGGGAAWGPPGGRGGPPGGRGGPPGGGGGGGPSLGGVNTDMRRRFAETGKWPVVGVFGLGYPVAFASDGQSRE